MQDSEQSEDHFNGKFVSVLAPTDHQDTISIVFGHKSAMMCKKPEDIPYEEILGEVKEGFYILREYGKKTTTSYPNGINNPKTVEYYSKDTISFVRFYVDDKIINEIKPIIDDHEEIRNIYFSSCHFKTKILGNNLNKKLENKNINIIGCTQGKNQEPLTKMAK